MSWATVSDAIRFWTGPDDTWDSPGVSQNSGVAFTEAESWSRSSEQSFRVDRWSLCRG